MQGLTSWYCSSGLPAFESSSGVQGRQQIPRILWLVSALATRTGRRHLLWVESPTPQGWASEGYCHQTPMGCGWGLMLSVGGGAASRTGAGGVRGRKGWWRELVHRYITWSSIPCSIEWDTYFSLMEERRRGVVQEAWEVTVPEKDLDGCLRDGPETTREEQRAGWSRALLPPGC